MNISTTVVVYSVEKLLDDNNDYYLKCTDLSTHDVGTTVERCQSAMLERDTLNKHPDTKDNPFRWYCCETR